MLPCLLIKYLTKNNVLIDDIVRIAFINNLGPDLNT